MTQRLVIDRVENVMRNVLAACDEIKGMSDKLDKIIAKINATFDEVENDLDDFMQ